MMVRGNVMVDPVVCQVWTALAAHRYDTIELEWRIGHRQGAFRPGVGEEAWLRLQTALEASPAFSKRYVESVETMGDVKDMKCIDGVRWMRKQRLADVDRDPCSDLPWSVRASLSLEEAMEGNVAVGVPRKYKRHKKRWSYVHMCWSIDLTRVSSNLPAHREDDKESFEVEIELVDPGIMFERPLSNIVEWGWKTANEVCDLMRMAC